MKTIILLAATLFAASIASALTDTQREAYKPTSIKAFRLDPKEYRNDKIALTGAYLGFASNFYNYMEESGFKPDRYVAFSVDSAALPIFMRKKDDLLAQLQTLKRGMKVTVYGRVKEFRSEPKDARLPKYYLEYEDIKVEMEAPAAKVSAAPAERFKPLKDRRKKRR